MRRRPICFLVLVSALLGFQSGARSDEMASGAHVYSHAIQAMSAIGPPAYMRYREDVSFSHTALVFKQPPGERLHTMIYIGKNDTARSYDVTYRTEDGTVVMRSPDGKERYVGDPAPWNVMWNAIVGIGKADAGQTDATPKATAVPFSDAPDKGDAPLLPIGSVSVFSSRYYRIENTGSESTDNSLAYHLRFVPLADPDAHPLRDVWVDTTSYRFCKAVVRIHKSGTAHIEGSITYGFSLVDRYWLATRAHFEASAQVAFYRTSGSLDMAASEFTVPERVASDEFTSEAR